MVCVGLAAKLGVPKSGPREQLISYVTNRPGHDQRYAIDATRMRRELGWTPNVTLDDGIRRTIDWYLARQDWCDVVRRSFWGDRQGKRAAQSR